MLVGTSYEVVSIATAVCGPHQSTIFLQNNSRSPTERQNMVNHLFVQGHLADVTFLKHLLSDGPNELLNPLLKTAYVIGWRKMLYGSYSVLVPNWKHTASRDVCDGFVVDMDDEQMLYLHGKEAQQMNLRLIDCDINIPQGTSQIGTIVDQIAGQMLVWGGDNAEMKVQEGQFDLVHWEDVAKPSRLPEDEGRAELFRQQ